MYHNVYFLFKLTQAAIVVSATDNGVSPESSTAQIIVTFTSNPNQLPPTWDPYDDDGNPIYESTLTIPENDTGVVVTLEASVSNGDQLTYGIVNGRTWAENRREEFVRRSSNNQLEIVVNPGSGNLASEEVGVYSLRLRASVSG